jgi:hypothetical protein
MLLGLLENLPSVIVIGTTTSTGTAWTVYSRWRRFRFRKPDAKAVADHLERIARELSLPIPDGFRFISYVQGKYDGRSNGNNLRDLMDGLADTLRRFKAERKRAPTWDRAADAGNRSGLSTNRSSGRRRLARGCRSPPMPGLSIKLKRWIHALFDERTS